MLSYEGPQNESWMLNTIMQYRMSFIIVEVMHA